MSYPLSYKEGHARNSDPGTSHQAAEQVDTNPLVKRLLFILRLYGPQTMKEACINSDIAIESGSPRFAEMRRLGLIEPCGKKRNAGSRAPAILWRVV